MAVRVREQNEINYAGGDRGQGHNRAGINKAVVLLPNPSLQPTRPRSSVVRPFGPHSFLPSASRLNSIVRLPPGVCGHVDGGVLIPL